MATHQQRHLQEDPTASSTHAPVIKSGGFFSPHVPVSTMHEHEVGPTRMTDLNVLMSMFV